MKLIDADLVEKEIQMKMSEWKGTFTFDGFQWSLDIVQSAPTIEVPEHKERHGYWYTNPKHYLLYFCSECGEGSIVKKRFCPECGTKMDRREEDCK